MYKRGELLEAAVMIGGQAFQIPVLEIHKTGLIVHFNRKDRKIRFANVLSWHMPFSHKLEVNAHFFVGKCNKGSDTWF